MALRDPQGRTTERLVTSADTAAALVESWARRDIADPLLEPRAPPPPPPPPAPEPAPSVVLPVPVAPPPSQWLPVLQLSGESWNRSVWLAGAVGACIHVGRLCLGGTARLAQQLQPRERALDDRLWLSYRQTDLAALALAELPISLGRPVLLLGLGVGLGALRRSRRDRRAARRGAGRAGPAAVVEAGPGGGGGGGDGPG